MPSESLSRSLSRAVPVAGIRRQPRHSEGRPRLLRTLCTVGGPHPLHGRHHRHYRGAARHPRRTHHRHGRRDPRRRAYVPNCRHKPSPTFPGCPSPRQGRNTTRRPRRTAPGNGSSATSARPSVRSPLPATGCRISARPVRFEPRSSAWRTTSSRPATSGRRSASRCRSPMASSYATGRPRANLSLDTADRTRATRRASIFDPKASSPIPKP